MLTRHLQEGYANLSKLDKFKFEQIFDYIWEKRTWRHLVVDDWHMEIPKTIYREELDSYKNTIRSLLLKFFETPNAPLIFTFEKKDGKIQASALHHHHNMVEQISPEELKLTYSFDAETGNPIDPPDNYVFTTFDFKC